MERGAVGRSAARATDADDDASVASDGARLAAVTPDELLARLLLDESLPLPTRTTDGDCIAITVRYGAKLLAAHYFPRVPARNAIRVTDQTGPALYAYDERGLETAIAELRR